VTLHLVQAYKTYAKGSFRLRQHGTLSFCLVFFAQRGEKHQTRDEKSV
jgi:hypothetical protein